MTFINQNTSLNKISTTQKLSRLIAIAGSLTPEVANRQRMISANRETDGKRPS